MVAACCLKVRNTVIVTGGTFNLNQRARQPTESYHSVPVLSWQHGGSTLSPVRNTLILQENDRIDNKNKIKQNKKIKIKQQLTIWSVNNNKISALHKKVRKVKRNCAAKYLVAFKPLALVNSVRR